VRAKDDSDLKEKKEAEKFNQNQYWKVPDQYDLDELLAEQDEDAPKHISVEVERSEEAYVPDPANFLSPVFEPFSPNDEDDDQDEPAVDKKDQTEVEESKGESEDA
jgi:hypothetical protein